jgi:23S rRNA pseudouridine1911/1915/1917 synthase
VSPTAPHVERFVASIDDAGDRLDVFLARKLPALSRSRIQKLIRSGQVALGGDAAKTSTPIAAGLVIDVTIPPPEPATPEAESVPLSILYDDDDIAVIDKPAGMVVHPASGHRHGTLVNALLHHLKGLSGIGGVERPGIVHRLDRGTSGIMVIAKHDVAHRSLSRQFHDRLVTKEYLALVWGDPGTARTIAQPIGRDPNQRLKMSSRATRGRSAVTRIVDVERLGDVSLVRVAIGTGRTHQIRVHLSEAGHAVVGDELYGGVHRRVPSKIGVVMRLDRPFLHAAHLAFAHPRDGRRLAFDAPLPGDLAGVLAALRGTKTTS